jgi:CHAT domain-containing protein
LVVLSGCQTGLTSLSPGDEMMGLLRGFLAAGVPSLVLSLWAAHDAPTTEFMEVFYRQLSDGRSKREAIARAYREMKERYADPYFWAPFFLMGSPE